MKNNLTLCAIGLGMMALASCSKSEVISNPSGELDAASKRANQPATVTYGGQATALNATITTIQNGTVYSNQSLVANTGFLPIAGGTLSANEVIANVQNVVTAENLTAAVSGTDNQTAANSSASNFNLTVNGYVITADIVSSSATAVCGSTSGSSQITNLVINGQSVTVTGAPNQMIFFPTGGFVMINGQSVSKGKNKNITVTGLHINIPNAADVKVAVSRAEIKC